MRGELTVFPQTPKLSTQGALTANSQKQWYRWKLGWGTGEETSELHDSGFALPTLVPINRPDICTSFSYCHCCFSSKDAFVFPWCAYRQFSVSSATLVCFLNIFFSLGKGSHCTGWPGTHNAVSSASCMLGLQVCTTIPSLNICTFTCPFCLNKTILKNGIHEMCIQFKSILN